MSRKLLYILCLTLLLSACGGPDKPTISLYLAVQRGDIDQVERHIYWDSEINAPFPNGRYPLHEAANAGRIILVKLLIKNGADLSVEDSLAYTPIDLAILSGRTQAAEVLRKAGAGFDASRLLLAAAKRDTEDRDVVRFLKSHGADMEARSSNGDTALLIAAKRANNRLLHHLAEQGSDINAQDAEGQTALDIATRKGSMELVGFLQRNGGVSGSQ